MAAAQLVSHMIVGMAGHVDHGKSALVTALTGRPMDRLAEEQRRGITIDLNFAPLHLSAGVTGGIIDVPGHEDLVRTMVAGVSGVDVALLVIAADEGIMPQTREHLLVLEQLRVPMPIAVITKADIAEPDWLELVQADVTEWTGRSSLAFGPPVVTSAKSGQGMDALRARLAAVTSVLRERDAGDLFRLPVDRVFTVKGTGTVVTGTAISGVVVVGEAVRLLPSGQEARVRSIESHGVALKRSEPGARTAVSLSGVERHDIARGEVLVRAVDRWQSSTRVEVELALGKATTLVLRDRIRVRLHHGTAEVMARVRLDAPLEPGGRALARLDLESPIVARGDDPVVVRSNSPMTVIGGGRVLDPLPEGRRRVLPDLAAVDGAERLDALVQRRRMGLEHRLLPVLLGLPPGRCVELVEGATTLMVAGERLLSRALVERLAADLVAEVESFHGREPSEPGMSVETLRRSLRVPDPVAAAALAIAEQSARLAIRAGVASRPAFRVVPLMSEARRQQLLAAVREAGLTVPGAADLGERLGLPGAVQALQQASLRGEVAQIEKGRYVATEALEAFAVLLGELGGEGRITPGALRDRTGLSRKYLIPLLEWADRTGLTLRDGDGRRVRPPRPAAGTGA